MINWPNLTFILISHQMNCFSVILLFFIFEIEWTTARTLQELIDKSSGKKHRPDRHEEVSSTNQKSNQRFGSPSQAELYRWQHYEENEPGTGLVPDSGPNYGPGLGDVEIRTAVGVRHPFGGLLYRRDFGLFMGGSGRSGGHAFGWGNGYQGLNGAAPWN